MKKYSNLVNLGWYQGKALYYDLEKEQLKLSNLLQNTEKIQTYTPAFILIVGPLLRMIAKKLVVDSFNIRLIILILTIFLTGNITRIAMVSMKKKTTFSIVNLEVSEGKEFIEKAKNHYKVIRITQLLGTPCVVLLSILYLTDGDMMMMILGSILSYALIMIHYDYQMSKRKKILQHLEEKFAKAEK